MNGINPTITVSSSTKTDDGERDEFFDKRVPPDGFAYPRVGTKVTVMVNYETPAVRELILPAGACGIVTCVRKPGSFKDNPGYIGCGVAFPEISHVYMHGGLIVPWDRIRYFSFGD